ncbi:MAG TPA: hypothetical protein DEW46_05715 [Verrucomicrobia bacterium]|nr:hypothetical protein [Verrucomicrobiota bacterium]
MLRQSMSVSAQRNRVILLSPLQGGQSAEYMLGISGQFAGRGGRAASASELPAGTGCLVSVDSLLGLHQVLVIITGFRGEAPAMRTITKASCSPIWRETGRV